jgi:glycosyltransferase involved in cell wall biosynthesis
MISVVIPLYNKAHTIESTLNSVLVQSFTEFEIVIIDDGSTDNGVEIIKEFSSDHRIKVVSQINQGVSVARNIGVANSQFEYIAFLDGDDEWLPDYLSKMKEAIELFPIAGMYCSAGIIKNGDGTQNYRLAEKYKDKIVEIDFFENPHVYVHTSATIVSKSIFNKTIGFPKGIWDEDFFLFFSIALIAPVIYSGYLLSVYVGGVEGQSTTIIYKEDGTLRKDSVPRHNLLYQNFIDSKIENKNFIIFLKYELRHSIKIHLINNEYMLVEHLLNNLIPAIKAHFTAFEMFLYRKSPLNKIALIYILFTKLRWRFRGYPRIDVKKSKIF